MSLNRIHSITELKQVRVLSRSRVHQQRKCLALTSAREECSWLPVLKFLHITIFFFAFYIGVFHFFCTFSLLSSVFYKTLPTSAATTVPRLPVTSPGPLSSHLDLLPVCHCNFYEPSPPTPTFKDDNLRCIYRWPQQQLIYNPIHVVNRDDLSSVSMPMWRCCLLLRWSGYSEGGGVTGWG